MLNPELWQKVMNLPICAEPDNTLGLWDINNIPTTFVHREEPVRKFYQSSDETIMNRDQFGPHTASVSIHKPASSEYLLCLKTTHQLERLRLKGSWFRLIPSRVGQDSAVDLAVQAFVKANAYAVRSEAVTAESTIHSYNKAIGRLQKFMSCQRDALSDSSLLACALLAHTERAIGFPSRQKEKVARYALTHLYGAQAILTSRPPTEKPSELSLAMVSGLSTILFDIPVALGTPSPFENMKWFESEPTSSDAPSEQIDRLRRIGHKLLTQLPKLIMYMRTWRGSYVPSRRMKNKINDTTTALAKSLLALKDEGAENTLLHRLRVNKTSSPLIASVIPYSFTFMSIADFEAAMYYWQARILVIRICWRIAHHDYWDKDVLAEEGLRTTQNLLMSWQYGLEQAIYGRIRLIYAIPAIWGAVTDFDGQSSSTESKLRPWLLLRTNDLYQAFFGKVSQEDLDVVAEVYAGGELEGILVRLYQQSWPRTYRK